MKKIISILLTLTILACSMPVIFAAGGTGTEEDPILIGTWAELMAIDAANSEGVYYKLTDDIDAGYAEITNGIGGEDAPFKGIFDGAGHVISNFYVVSWNWEAIEPMGHALFDYVGGNAVIKNLGIEDADLQVYVYSKPSACLVGKMVDNATVTDCYVKNCKSVVPDDKDGTNGPPYGGAMIGLIEGSGASVINCYSTGCDFSAGTVSYRSDFISYARDFKELTNCYSDRTFGNRRTGYGTETNCYKVTEEGYTLNGVSHAGVVTAAATLKGYASTLGSAFIADTTAENVNNGYPMLAWEKNRYTFQGESEQNPISIRTAEELAAITGADSEGKYYRLENDIDMNNAVWTNYIGTADEPFKGNFDGGGHIIKNYTMSMPNKGAGGLFLYVGGDAVIKNLGVENVTVTLSHEWNYSSVVGPIAAYAIDNATITDCYSKNVTFESRANAAFGNGSGLIGYINGAGVTLKNCYVLGFSEKDDACSSEGALAGGLASFGLISNCYSDTTIGCYPTSTPTGTVENTYCTTHSWYANENRGAGEIVTADALKTKASSLGSAYIMDSPYSDVNDGYPMLAWERGKLNELNIATPGIIDSKEDMLALSSFWAADPYGLEGMYFRVDADIDLGGEQMQYYLTGSESKPFKGDFNGNGHKISNYIYSSWDWKNSINLTNCKFGLFSYIGGNAHIYNLGVEDIEVKTAMGWYINSFGGLVAVMVDNSALTGCYAKNVTYTPAWDFEGWNGYYDNGTSKAGINQGAGLVGLLDGAGVELRQCYAVNIDDSRTSYTDHNGEEAVFGLVMNDAGVFGNGNNFLKVADCYSDTYVGSHKSSLYIDNCYQQLKHTEWYTGYNWGAWNTNVVNLSDRWCDDFYITGDGETMPMLKWEKGDRGLNLVKGGTMNIAEDAAKTLFGTPDAKIINGASTAYIASFILELPAENTFTYSADLTSGNYYKVSFRGRTIDGADSGFVFTLGDTDLTELLVDKTLGSTQETKTVYVKAAADGAQTLTIDAEVGLYLDDIEITKVDGEYEKKAIAACIGLNHYKVDALESDMYVEKNVYDGVDIVYTSDNGYFDGAGRLTNLPVGLGKVADKLNATANVADLSVTESIDVNVKMLEPYNVTSINLVDAEGSTVYDIAKAAKVKSVTVTKNETEAATGTKLIVAAYSGDTVTAVKTVDAADGEITADLSVAGADKVKVFTMVTNMAKPLSVVELTYDSLGDDDAIEIHTIGDSIVTTYEESNPLRGWGQMIQSFFDADNVTVDNSLSRGGMSAREFIESADRYEKLLPKLDKNDYVLIQLAHNDAGAYSKEDYKALVHQLVTGIRDKGAVAVFVTSPATSVSATDTLDEGTGKYVVNDRLKGFPQTMRELAAEIGVPVVDLNAHTMELMADLGYTGIIDLGYWSTDTVHFGEAGASYLARFIANEIKAMNLPISDYIIAQ